MADIRSEPQSNHKLDFFGMSLSTLCALHCIVPPILLALLPALQFDQEALEVLHPFFIVFALPLAFLALRRGYATHASTQPFWLVLLGLAALIAALFVEEPHWLETAITLVGSSLVVFAHAINYRLCKWCPKCAED